MLKPLKLSAYLAIATLLFTHILQLFTQRDLYFIGHLELGFDFNVFWRAAINISQGNNPYVDPTFVTPTFLPLLIWRCGFLALPFTTAAKAMFVISLLCVLSSCWMAAKIFIPAQYRNSAVGHLVAMALASFPTYFLIDRGNIDGITMALMWLGFWLGFGNHTTKTREIFSGLALAAAVGCKFYPIVLLVPLLFFKRFRIAIAMVIGITIIFLTDWENWRDFVMLRIVNRVGWFTYDENASIEVFFAILRDGINSLGGWFADYAAKIFAKGCLGIFAIILTRMTFVFRNTKDRQLQLAIACLYLPIVIGSPSLTYAYMLVNLLPLAAVCSYFWDKFPTPRVRRSLLVAATGIGLAQFQAKALAAIFTYWNYSYNVVSAGCSVGLFITLVGLATFQWLSTKEPSFDVDRATSRL